MMKKIMTGAIIAFCLFYAHMEGIAQDSGRALPSESELNKAAQKEAQKIQEREDAELERLKTADYKSYLETKSLRDRQEKISDVLSLFRVGKISADKAEAKLYPLIKEEVQPELKALPEKIKKLEGKLEYYKKAKSNPDLLIKKYIDQLLGRSLPSDDDL
jgi:hypothetical protein